MKDNPKSRIENIVVQEFANEILIYDLKTNKAFCLNETSAMIYQLCDGTKTVSDINNSVAKKLNQPVTEDLIWLALDSFKKDNLLEESEQFEINFNGLSRRQVIKKIGFSSLIALPLISSIVAPNAAMAQSGGPTNLALNAACMSNAQCASGNCVNNTRCCSATSTDTFAPNLGIGLFGGPPGTCATYPQADQNVFCNSVGLRSQCCSGEAYANGCLNFAGGTLINCYCT